MRLSISSLLLGLALALLVCHTLAAPVRPISDDTQEASDEANAVPAEAGDEGQAKPEDDGNPQPAVENQQEQAAAPQEAAEDSSEPAAQAEDKNDGPVPVGRADDARDEEDDEYDDDYLYADEEADWADYDDDYYAELYKEEYYDEEYAQDEKNGEKQAANENNHKVDDANASDQVPEPAQDQTEKHHRRQQKLDEEYARYLEEMEKNMAVNRRLRDGIIKEVSSKHMANREQEEEELLKIALRLKNEDVRSKLEEQERQIIEKQRRTAIREDEIKDGLKHRANHETFGEKDVDDISPEQLQKLKKRRAEMLRSIDKKLYEAFRQREMKREIELRQRVKEEPDPAKRNMLIQQHRQYLTHLRETKFDEPGRRKHIERMWELDDHMEGFPFNAKVFFRMHDINSDGYLDAKEVEAAYSHSAMRMHKPEANEDIDMAAVRQEMVRMRQHTVDLMDKDADGLISKQEFEGFVDSPEFDQDEPWTPLVLDFKDEDLSKFEKRIERVAKHRLKEEVLKNKHNPNQRIELDVVKRLRNKHLEAMNRAKERAAQAKQQEGDSSNNKEPVAAEIDPPQQA